MSNPWGVDYDIDKKTWPDFLIKSISELEARLNLGRLQEIAESVVGMKCVKLVAVAAGMYQIASDFWSFL